MLGSLLKQIVSGMENIPEEISQAFQEQKKAIGGCGPPLVDIVKMLQFITSLQPTFICIDALDECVGVQRFKVLDSLKQILEKSRRTRIFVTGRPHILAEIEKRLAGQVKNLSVGPSKADIITYLRSRLGEDETPDAMDESLEAEILERIPESISEMCVGVVTENLTAHDPLIDVFRFLLVSLNIDTILQESTIHRRRERLRKMTRGLGLGDAYDATIERIKAQGGDRSRLGMEALMWVSHAERPLTADELCHALAVELDTKDLNGGNAPSISTLVSCCQGLITIDKKASTVRLIHFTLQEYLSSHPDIFSRPHSTIAEICLTYLNFKQVKAIPANRSPDLSYTPFLKYCSLYWGVHAKRELSDNESSLALELFQEYDDHISIRLLLEQVEHRNVREVETSFLFNGLHCASFFGIVEVAAAFLEMECYDINAGDFWGTAPLAWAACNGHEEVVKILLGQEAVNPDKRDNDGCTPLSYAASRGHEGVVKILLGRHEVNPDRPSNHGLTPLSYAARNGHEGVLKILLGRKDVNPDKPNNDGYTPLSYAAWGGYEGMVNILLRREEVNPDKSDNDGWTPLTHAVFEGHEGVVGVLLSREEVNPDKPEYFGRTPLSYAASGGYEGIVKMLLGRKGVNPDKPGNNGWTPLSYAASRGHEGVVKILLGRPGVGPNKATDYDSTPLLLAAMNGHEGVLKILLRRKDVNPDKPGDDGRTPLSYAASRGHEGVVKILLGRKEVNPDKPDNDDWTPLSHAASTGHEGVVKVLLGRHDVNPDRPSNHGSTPLSYAARNGHEGALKILLGRNDVNPDRPNNYGSTPLAYAARNGYEGVVEMLLGREEVNPSKPDNHGRTPLILATRYGHKRVIELLKAHEAAIPRVT